MKLSKSLTLLLGTAAMFALYGCGSSNRESAIDQQSASFQASAGCISCHSTKVSPVTGALIVDEWKASKHNTGNGASCGDCHKPQGHPNGSVTKNPSNAVCEECHTAATMRTGVAHFGDPADPTKAFYVSSLDRTGGVAQGNMTFPGGNGCQTCHNPHDTTTLMTINQQWAGSAHAATADLPFTEDPWRKQSSGNCGRCHTGSGFRYYVTNAQAVLPKATFGQYTNAREVVGCSACHTDYSWKRISSDPSITSFINFSTPYKRSAGIGKNFPSNVGDTKLCVPCHAGRTGGGDVWAVATLSNASVPSAHYLPAAGLMYMKQGFIDFVPGNTVIGTSTYAKTLLSADDLSGGVTSTHRKLGTTAINGDSHNPAFFVSGNLDSNGPCVVCHMKGGHSLKINASAFDQVCVKCHDSEGGVALTNANFGTIFLEPQKEVFENALKLAAALFESKYNIRVVFDATSGSAGFYDLTLDATGATACKDWTRGGTLTATEARYLLGAAFNVKLLSNDPAAYAHARTYTRRLIYDTIDFLDNKVNDLSVGTTALATQPAVYAKGATAYTDGTLTTLATGTTESMVYLIRWSRTTGAWDAPERP
ncbi:hypothetical protein KI811_18040 [Geobacter hydrogenophilus]|uniref:Doubled CXXCH motif domain-containing protein n=1 Tax=Geobacter hydrogenophilus TaxID=40983 RepID=A0A9W6LC57_9BACT|nr:cytochrome c3 family protein [Geobacter hydrogenophilus]MBT0895709.1 hypothetical protein [Geobacter hydrogenophilus]GLI37126.1 hypothetical protein GHYDROH2_06270 [Geobacter hydrogenophilus]